MSRQACTRKGQGAAPAASRTSRGSAPAGRRGQARRRQRPGAGPQRGSGIAVAAVSVPRRSKPIRAPATSRKTSPTAGVRCAAISSASDTHPDGRGEAVGRSACRGRRAQRLLDGCPGRARALASAHFRAAKRGCSWPGLGGGRRLIAGTIPASDACGQSGALCKNRLKAPPGGWVRDLRAIIQGGLHDDPTEWREDRLPDRPGRAWRSSSSPSPERWPERRREIAHDRAAFG